MVGSLLSNNVSGNEIKNNNSSDLTSTGIHQTAQVIPEIKLNEDELFIARVLYSETSTLCSFEEILAVACVIQNRIGLRDFGRCKTAKAVCLYKNAFSSVRKHNVNWDQYKPNLNEYAAFDAKLAKILANPNIKLNGVSWMSNIVYYHDKSIKKPSAWDNKYYTAVLVKETKNFKFYKVVPKKVGKKGIKK